MTQTNDCPFCNKSEFILENEHWICIYDNYPVSNGHTLIIPKRHFNDYFLSTELERSSFDKILFEVKEHLDKEYSPDGYNVGFNVNEEGGQSIFHCHIHIIPRYRGDVENPRGGIRGVIPSKQNY
jgi:diadenosine tetraphosphate (Ap4A) HIT family hydrolase